MERRIITISREAGAYGHEFTNMFKEHFDMTVLDETTLPSQKGKYGIPDFPLERFDEKQPPIWENFSMRKERYVAFLRSAVFDIGLQHDAVIVGHGGAVILAGVPGVLHLRLVANEEKRITVLMQRENSSHDRARQQIRHVDHVRRGFNRFFFDTDWADAEHYDMVLNVGLLSSEQVINVIEAAFQCCPEKERCLPTLQNCLLSEKISVELLYHAELKIDLLEVAANAGHIVLRGVVQSTEVYEQSFAIVKDLPEVKEVTNHLRIIDNDMSYLMTI